MTTTKIYYTPPGQSGTARFDVPGSNVANVALTEVLSPTQDPGSAFYIYRSSNNYYTWVVKTSNPSKTFANVSMINWGNIQLQDYTFPGGGTLSSTVSNVSITGGWKVIREPVQAGSSGQQTYQFRTTGNPGFGPNGTANSDTIYRQKHAGVPNYTQWDNSPVNTFQNSAVQTYNISGNATTLSTPNLDTFSNVRFYANVENELDLWTGGGSDVIGNITIAFDYSFTRSYEVNLHSVTANLSSDISIGKFQTQTGTYFEPGSEIIVDYFDGDYAGGYVAAQDIGGYVDTNYIADQLVVEFQDGVLAGLAHAGNTSGTIDITATVNAIQTHTASAGLQSVSTIATTTGILYQVNTDNTIETAFAAGDLIGPVLPAAAAAEIESVWTDTEPNLLRGFNATFTEATDFEPQARNIIGISDGIGYITTDYAEADYFSEGAGLTIFADSSLLEVDANIIRSDGTILFEGDLSATIQPGFQIDAGIITQAAAEFEISPYTTAGTGLLFAAAADLEQQASAAIQGGSLIIAAAEQIVIESQVVADTTTAILGETAIDLFRLALASESESRPSIKATIELLDGTGSLTATPFVDQSSRAALAIDNMQVQALAGYTLFGNTTNTIGINADFSSEGRIYYIDEYYMSQVAAETRLLSVRADAASLLVESETRVNTSLAENRGLVVEPETRTAKPELLPTTLKGARLRRIPV